MYQRTETLLFGGSISPCLHAQPALYCEPDTSISFFHFSPFLCHGCCSPMNPLLFAHICLLRRCPVQSKAFQLEPGQSPAASQLFLPCILHEAHTDLPPRCCHLAPLTCHTVSPLDLKILKLFLCSAWLVIPQTHPFELNVFAFSLPVPMFPSSNLFILIFGGIFNSFQPPI